MRLMGIDFGTKNVGLALSDPDGMLAFPHGVIVNTDALVDEVATKVAEHDVSTVVVGESRNFRGDANPVHEHASVFVDALRNAVRADVVFEPEYLTTAHATRLQGRSTDTDASAAAIILQTYLDKQNNHG